MAHIYLIKCYRKVDGEEEFNVGETYMAELTDESVFNIYKSSTLHEKAEVVVAGNFIERLSFESGRAFLEAAGYEWQMLHTVVPRPEYIEGMMAMPFDVAMTYLNNTNE